MKRIALLLLMLLSSFMVTWAKDVLGQVTVTLNDGTVVRGYCENPMKHERTKIKISPSIDGKNAVKYKAESIQELSYIADGDTLTECWRYDGRILLMKQVRLSGAVFLWVTCVGEHELIGSKGMRYVERVRECISFGPALADNTAWDLLHIKLGRCKQLAGFSDFVKAYKKSHPDGDWDDTDTLVEMCRAYVDSMD